MHKVMLTVGGLVPDAIIEGWIIPGRTWNGFVKVVMTEAQLDAFIKAQDPERSPDEVDKIFFDKHEGYSIQNENGDCEKLDKFKALSPDGEILYDMSLSWCWEICNLIN